MTPRPCLDCGVRMARGGARGARCTPCQRRWDAQRNARPQRQAYQDPTYRGIPLVGACVDCGSTDNLTRDHIIELHNGGTNDPSNIAIRCLPCNIAKSNRTRRQT